MPQTAESRTADDPARWLRRACASGPQVHQYIPVRFSALLALGPACRPDSKRHPDFRLGAPHLEVVSAFFICPNMGDLI
jgi:hypothetical protein